MPCPNISCAMKDMVLLSLQLFEQFSYEKEPKDSRTQCCVIWEMVCKHLVFLEEKGERPKVMGDALNITSYEKWAQQSNKHCSSEISGQLEKGKLAAWNSSVGHFPWHPGGLAKKVRWRAFPDASGSQRGKGLRGEQLAGRPDNMKSQKHQRVCLIGRC